MATKRNKDQTDVLDYKRPTKEIKQDIADALMELYPPTRIEDATSDVAMITSEMKVSYFFHGVKVEIKDGTCKVQDTSCESNAYRELGNRFMLNLLLKFIREKQLEVEIKERKIYRRDRQ